MKFSGVILRPQNTISLLFINGSLVEVEHIIKLLSITLFIDTCLKITTRVFNSGLCAACWFQDEERSQN